jgi:hypothetical protein
MMEPTQETLAADTGRFLKLRGDVRQIVRITEVEMQTTIIQMLQKLVPLLGPEIVTGMQSIIGSTPAKFLNDNFVLFEELSQARDNAETLQASTQGARNAGLN